MSGNEKNSILVVDENGKFRNDLKSKLSAYRYNVDQATTGFHALHMIEKGDYNIVITGTRMREMSGLELIGLIKDVYVERKIKIVVLDRGMKKEELAKYEKREPDIFISQRLPSDELIKQIREFIDGGEIKLTKLGSI